VDEDYVKKLAARAAVGVLSSTDILMKLLGKRVRVSLRGAVRDAGVADVSIYERALRKGPRLLEGKVFVYITYAYLEQVTVQVTLYAVKKITVKTKIYRKKTDCWIIYRRTASDWGSYFGRRSLFCDALNTGLEYYTTVYSKREAENYRKRGFVVEKSVKYSYEVKSVSSETIVATFESVYEAYSYLKRLKMTGRSGEYKVCPCGKVTKIVPVKVEDFKCYSFTVAEAGLKSLVLKNPSDVKAVFKIYLQKVLVDYRLIMDESELSQCYFEESVPPGGSVSVPVECFAEEGSGARLCFEIKLGPLYLEMSVLTSCQDYYVESLEDIVGPIDWKVFFEELAWCTLYTLPVLVAAEVSPVAGRVIVLVGAVTQAIGGFLAQGPEGKTLLELLIAGRFAEAAGVGGNYVLDSLCEMFTGINRKDWDMLLHKKGHPKERARALARVMFSIAVDISTLIYHAAKTRRKLVNKAFDNLFKEESAAWAQAAKKSRLYKAVLDKVNSYLAELSKKDIDELTDTITKVFKRLFEKRKGDDALINALADMVEKGRSLEDSVYKLIRVVKKLETYRLDEIPWKTAAYRNGWLEMKVEGLALKYNPSVGFKYRVGDKWRKVVEIKVSDLIHAISITYSEPGPFNEVGASKIKTAAKLILNGRVYDLYTRVILKGGEKIKVKLGESEAYIIPTGAEPINIGGKWYIRYFIKIEVGSTELECINGERLKALGSSFNLHRKALIIDLGNNRYLRFYLDDGTIKLQSGRKHYYKLKEVRTPRLLGEIQILSFEETSVRVVLAKDRKTYLKYFADELLSKENSILKDITDTIKSSLKNNNNVIKLKLKLSGVNFQKEKTNIMGLITELITYLKYRKKHAKKKQPY